MRVDNPSAEHLAAYFTVLDERAEKAGRADNFKYVRYLDLGTRVVRLVNYSKAFTPHIEKQLTYVLRDAAPHYDLTLIVWQEKDFDTLPREMALRPDPEAPIRERAQKLFWKTKPWQTLDERLQDKRLQVFDHAYSIWHSLIDVTPWNQTISSYNPVTATYYYAVENLLPEEFIKQGHVFIQTLNKILKGPDSALAHGAAIGLDNTGILFCARGQRGKSTLAVRAMLDGFDYVADDYLVLGREASGLYAWPIYSIITLAPMMYGDLYPTLDAKFVSNNARKDKYVFNIERYHERFASRYPIKMAMFVQITSETKPWIETCSQAGKGRAVVELVYSTINQMSDRHDIATIKKLMDFVRDLPFYQINLCRDIEKNLQCLRDFLRTGECGQQVNSAGMLHSRSVPGIIMK